ARQRAASRPTQPNRSLDAAVSCGRILSQSRGSSESRRPGSFSGISCASLTSPAAGADASSVGPLDPLPAVDPRGGLVDTTPSIVGRLDLGPQPSARHGMSEPDSPGAGGGLPAGCSQDGTGRGVICRAIWRGPATLFGRDSATLFGFNSCVIYC